MRYYIVVVNYITEMSGEPTAKIMISGVYARDFAEKPCNFNTAYKNHNYAGHKFIEFFDSYDDAVETCYAINASIPVSYYVDDIEDGILDKLLSRYAYAVKTYYKKNRWGSYDPTHIVPKIIKTTEMHWPNGALHYLGNDEAYDYAVYSTKEQAEAYINRCADAGILKKEK